MITALALASLTQLQPAACSCHAFLPKFDLVAATGIVPDPTHEDLPNNPAEPNLVNVRQLTFGGQNAEAYWNVEGTKIVYQSRQPNFADEQIFTMNPDGSEKTLVSTGLGRCSCSYFSPDGKWIYFSSTHEFNRGAQEHPDMSKGYVWVVNPWFTMYRSPAVWTGDGPRPIERVLRKFGYIAETTIAPNGKYMTFTGGFEGDLDIYRADLDGGNVQRLTHDLGYDGGPFVSWDSKKIVFRRDLIESKEELHDYQELFKQNMVRPGKLEIWIMNADGSGKKQLTNLKSASFAPFMHPNGKTIVFSSNYGDPKGREFDIYAIDVNGKNLRQITKTPEFDGFPMFSKDGKRLVFASNRNGKVKGETNIFVCDWKE